MKKLGKFDFWKVGMAMLTGITIVAPFTALADLPTPGCGQLQGVRCDVTGPNDLIIKAINILLGVAALVAVLFLVIGGFRYITSAGNDEQAKAGRKTIINALIGLVVVILAYVIVSAVNKTVSSSGTANPIP